MQVVGRAAWGRVCGRAKLLAGTLRCLHLCWRLPLNWSPSEQLDVSEPAEPAPTISAISADKTSAALNEEITFTLTVKNTTSIRVYIDGSVNRYIYDVTDGTMTYKLSFTDAGSGTRTVAFEPCRGDVVGAKTAGMVITLANS